ncbi:hypothetical protein F0L68_38840 [Solihabitans fulvus]|uniref:SPW repeat-containing protein n=1 Tax=Solihabitans fulvus TaxID=1892852 RepID=A0A5B2WJT2_9PSEU|nr:hypothetical protein [Solihabitans fulvus]KAA2250716.1 hypothetical protein F0L68_38840 [Solihabitans fulvus]
MSRLRRLTRSSLVSFAGLLGAIAGLLIQWAANPAKFSGAQQSFGIPFPPGILFIVGAGLLMLVTSRWWWHPIFAVLIAFWIAVVGTLAGQLTPNLFSHNIGTVAGNAIMTAALLLSGVAGVVSMTSGRRTSAVPAPQ